MWWYRGLRALVAQASGARAEAPCRAAGPVLDAGCGTGGMLVTLGPAVAGHPTFGPGIRRRSPPAFAAAKAGRPVAAGSVNEMPLGDGALAGYVSLDVLCHGGVEPERAVKEAHRCLRPGAIAIFNLPAYDWLLSAHDRRVHNVRRFTRGQARALLAGNGFRVLKVQLLEHPVVSPDAAPSTDSSATTPKATCATSRAGSTRCSRRRSPSSGRSSAPASACRSAAPCSIVAARDG